MNKRWPTFLVVGAARAGTTSLYAYLKQHPQVFMSPLKEPHFFAQVKPLPGKAHLFQWIEQESEYLSLFCNAEGYLAIGEASPSYLWSSEAPYRIQEKIPKAQIIVLLRDPVERAYSHYLLDVRDGRQSKPFYEALIEDFYSQKKGWFVSHLYVELGLYNQQLSRYFDVFGREKVLILLFEDLKCAPKKVLAKVVNFLGIDQTLVPSINTSLSHNPFSTPRNKLAQRLIILSRNEHLQAPYRLYKRLVPRFLRDFLRSSVLRRSAKKKPPADDRAIAFLRSIYEPEIKALDKILMLETSTLKKFDLSTKMLQQC